jgi:hypothetical protein
VLSGEITHNRPNAEAENIYYLCGKVRTRRPHVVLRCSKGLIQRSEHVDHDVGIEVGSIRHFHPRK